MAKKSDWSKIENVFKFLKEADGRPPTAGEQALIRGQREINRQFFDAINTILETLSPSKGAAQKTAEQRSKDLAALKKAFQNVPGKAPPGCRGAGEEPPPT